MMRRKSIRTPACIGGGQTQEKLNNISTTITTTKTNKRTTTMTTIATTRMALAGVLDWDRRARLFYLLYISMYHQNTHTHYLPRHVTCTVRSTTVSLFTPNKSTLTSSTVERSWRERKKERKKDRLCDCVIRRRIGSDRV